MTVLRFNSEMRDALLSGRKTRTTRRTLKVAPDDEVQAVCDDKPFGTLRITDVRLIAPVNYTDEMVEEEGCPTLNCLLDLLEDIYEGIDVTKPMWSIAFERMATVRKTRTVQQEEA